MQRQIQHVRLLQLLLLQLLQFEKPLLCGCHTNLSGWEEASKPQGPSTYIITNSGRFLHKYFGPTCDNRPQEAMGSIFLDNAPTFFDKIAHPFTSPNERVRGRGPKAELTQPSDTQGRPL